MHINHIYDFISMQQKYPTTLTYKTFQTISSETADALILDCGYQASHVVPVLSGRVEPSLCRRMNIGGGYVDWFLQRLLQLKYPGHVPSITMARVEVSLALSEESKVY